MNRMEQTVYLSRKQNIHSLNHALQSDQMIDYRDLIASLFDTYQPSGPSVNVEEIKARLLDKADSGRFDTQFHADPGVVNKNSRTKYRVNEYVNLMVQQTCLRYKA